MIPGQLDIDECIEIAEAEGRICAQCTMPDDCALRERCFLDEEYGEPDDDDA